MEGDSLYDSHIKVEQSWCGFGCIHVEPLLHLSDILSLTSCSKYARILRAPSSKFYCEVSMSCNDHVFHVKDKVYPRLLGYVSQVHTHVGVGSVVSKLPNVGDKVLISHSRCLIQAVKAFLQLAYKVTFLPCRREACWLRHVNVFLQISVQESLFKLKVFCRDDS